MKKITNIPALILFLLILISCNRDSTFSKNSLTSNTEFSRRLFSQAESYTPTIVHHTRHNLYRDLASGRVIDIANYYNNSSLKNRCSTYESRWMGNAI